MELLHLALGVVTITLCFALLRGPADPMTRVVNAFTDGWTLLASFAAVSTGFVLHEFAHKLVAQRYGHWAEFRATFHLLLIGLLMALFVRLFMAAPGYVLIQGRPAPREYGIISIVGPGVNVLVCGLAFGTYALLEATNPRFGLDPDAPLELILSMVAVVNGLLAVFNLLPIRLPGLAALDGLKVWRWNKGVWAASFAFSVLFFAWVFVAHAANLFPA